MALNGYIRINGIAYDCHEEIEILFKTLFQNQMSHCKREDDLKDEIRHLKRKLKDLLESNVNDKNTHNEYMVYTLEQATITHVVELQR